MTSKKSLFGLWLGLLSSLASASATTNPSPPRAEQRPYTHTLFGDKREDPYYWLNRREDPKVLAYIAAENAYTDALMAPTLPLQEQLQKEYQSRLLPVEDSYPIPDRGYAYFTRTWADRNYAAYYRYPLGKPDKAELLVDANELAQGHSYFSLNALDISPDQKYLAYAVDTQGRRFYDILVIERASGKKVLTIPDTTGDLAWSEDSQAILYTRQDPKTLRSFEAYRHALNKKRAELLYREKDDTFSLNLSKSRSRRYIFLISSSTLTDEWRYLDSSDLKAKPKVFAARERGHKYSVEDGGDRFYILSNWKAQNFRVLETKLSKTEKSAWQELLAADPQIYRTGLEVFRDFLVVEEKNLGLDQLKVFLRKEQAWRTLSFPDPVYQAESYANEEFETASFTYSYESLATPPSVYRYDLSSSTSTLIYEKKVGGSFQRQDYVTERIMVKARDGVEVPLSLVYRKGLKKDGKNPTLIYGYGSYGLSMDPNFSLSRLSLLDRGFVFAMAHIRGGSTLGRSWYEAGKLLNKKNTFTDFIDCSRFLIDQQYTSTDRLFAQGGSAGGLLMGAVANMQPELYRGMVAQVPFVDVVTTMLDESIPLTTSEYDEWGDPRKKEYYTYMRSYSPFDNVEAKAYPNLLVTTGFHDSQVQYWEPAKWVARLREKAKGGGEILLRTDMNAGHGGASGRLKQFADQAFVHAFLLKHTPIEK